MDEKKTDGEPETEGKKIRFEIAKSIFKEILDANLHQSEIAARLLIPITFLTGGAVALFAIEYKISAFWIGIDIIPFLFLLYLFFTLGGTISFFKTIGPSFKWGGKFLSVEERRPKGPDSLLFFKSIEGMDSNKWMNYFYSEKNEKKLEEFLETDELQNKLAYDYIREAYLLAKKANTKVFYNTIAHWFFFFSFVTLFLMIYVGIISYFGLWGSFTKFLIILALAIFIAIEFGIAEKGYHKLKRRKGDDQE